MYAGRQRIDLVRHLGFFVAVADELHFGRAAEVVGVSQPPLSQGIQRLERKLGSVLFERGSRGVSLTPAGIALLPHARRVLADVTLLMSAADEAVSEPLGLRLGVALQVPMHSVAALVTSARLELGERRVEHVIGSTTMLLHAIAQGGLDAAVVVHPTPLAGLHAGPVARLPGRLLVATDYALAQHYSKVVPVTVLARSLPLVLPPRQHHPAAHDHLLDVAARHGVRISPRTAEDDRAALLAAASGNALTLTADPALSSSSVSNLAIEGDPFPLRLRLIRPTDTDRIADLSVLEALQNCLGDVAGGAR